MEIAGARFLIEQKIRPIGTLYVVSTADADGNAQQPVAFVRQKRFALKEVVRFFADEAETTELFSLKARQVIEFGGAYDVTAADGAPLGVLQKLGRRSLLRSSWRILGADGDSELFSAQERSALVAILRRIWGFIPVAGEWIPFLIPFHFDFQRDGTRVGSLTRKVALRDRYLLDVEPLVADGVEPRLLIAFGVALDMLQGR